MTTNLLSRSLPHFPQLEMPNMVLLSSGHELYIQMVYWLCARLSGVSSIRYLGIDVD